MFVNPLNLLQGKKTKEKSDKEKALDAKMEAAMNQAIRERNEQKAKEAASHVHQLVQPELSPQDVKSQTHVKEEPVNQLEAAPLNAASSLSLPESDMTGSGERGGLSSLKQLGLQKGLQSLSRIVSLSKSA